MHKIVRFYVTILNNIGLSCKEMNCYKHENGHNN